MMEWSPLILTFKLAFITTAVLFVLAIPLARWLALTKFRLKPAMEAIISLPLVLPPTVLGFYLLVLLNPKSVVGGILDEAGISLLFSFEGLVVASVIYSLPFMVQPIQAGLKNLPHSLTEASFVLGKSKLITLLRVQLPNIKPALLTGVILSFAHTIGEFGVVLMIGGNIPDKTRVASIAIYDQVESLNYDAANFYSIVLLVISFAILLGMYMYNGGYFKRVSE